MNDHTMIEASALFRPEILSDPHAFLGDLRHQAPVALAADQAGRPIYLVTSHALIEEVSRRTADFSNRMDHLLLDGGEGDREIAAKLAEQPMGLSLLLVSDDPDHRRYRALVNAAFATGRIAKMAPVIEEIADELIDGFIERGRVDFVNEFAVLLPTYIIADILGLPRERYSQVLIWSDAMIRIASRMGTREEQLTAAGLIVEFRRYILETIRARRDQPADDLISGMIVARVDGVEPLSDDEIGPLTFEIAVAGNETTRNTLMSGIVRLLNNPEQFEMLRTDPTLVANAVEEILRYETPATSMWRVAARSTELGGTPIPAGSSILLRYDAGNRDESRFSGADTFDIRRKNAHAHQSFGGAGMHRCLGQMLARRELQIAFSKLLDRLKGLHVIENESDTSYWPGLLHRGIGALTLGFEPGSRVRVV